MLTKKILALVLAISMVLSFACALASCDVLLEDLEEGLEEDTKNESEKEKVTTTRTSREQDTEESTEESTKESTKESIEKNTQFITKEEDTTVTEESTTAHSNLKMSEYTVEVINAAGRPMEGISIDVYFKDEIIVTGITDSDGKCVFDLLDGRAYTVSYGNVPEGYNESIGGYMFNGRSLEIVLWSSAIEDTDLDGVKYELGDVMRDFTVTTTDGETFTLSEVLEEKDCVMINFFFTSCGPCLREFPHIDSVASKYSDDVAVIAIDPIDTEEQVKRYKEEYGLTLDMATADLDLAKAFDLIGYPTSVFIDSHGVICLIEVGSLPSEEPFKRAFDYFTSPDYTQKLFESIDEIPNIENVENESVYKVRVVDTDGNAVSGAGVQLCNGDGCCMPVETNADGYAKFPMVTDECSQARIVNEVEGYVVDTDRYYDFEEGSLEMTIVLEKA